MTPEQKIAHWLASYGDQTAWMDKAACRGSKFDFVPENETSRGLRDAQRWCDVCEVRSECLNNALVVGSKGYWGGLDTSTRNKLRAIKLRAHCPSCLGKGLIQTELHQVCVACGRSWRTVSLKAERQMEEGIT